MRDQEVQPLAEPLRHGRPFMPSAVTEDVDGKKEKKGGGEKWEALWEVGFDRSLGEKKCEDEKERDRKGKREVATRILF